ncbi:MAG: protease inhibitor Inh/omp19 family protein [Hoeflea sp.]|uniref:protease inhibitor Inh/omp19 family protein n=1 Tax=Hoeflea sp. TaxID=1940281 RepID=UPI001DA6D18D|nr:protease inhibitor Inh/omp19 family protein [Hoeflea sp.]MBU4529861.1 protease inhibitor Inh/omp19 family protein [Alphaproteobacteria bacterium]MBU4547118.1 protease inhibitor Inh/omp19 family protein [Alphaproteobacteria bacterium]MBU4548731.1 protease inhibitor Inh/omp19 family protein [Alphaproteobacteria bacterium]MBV1722354.1 protease inhibitor Inh/omp19 family protein [Hoeflea sp.]MBV1762490.1 protease inhibitor Inh/omp19 family protein [Hoeflea sp.]
MKMHTLLVAVAVAAVLGGCQRTSYNGLNTQQQPAPLMPAPVGGVESGQLAPPMTPQPGEFPAAPTAQAPSVAPEVAAANAPEVTREALIGRWSASSGGSTCDVFLSLTKWTGGYRAASRGCVGNAAAISAWDVQGKQVILSDSSGNQVARLYQSANERYDGSTSAGQPISLSR